MAQHKPNFSFQFLGMKLEVTEISPKTLWMLGMVLIFFLVLFAIAKPWLFGAATLNQARKAGKAAVLLWDNIKRWVNLSGP